HLERVIVWEYQRQRARPPAIGDFQRHIDRLERCYRRGSGVRFEGRPNLLARIESSFSIRL
ncbi:hypothetical protein M8C21_033211, partial [Ambrosia artemisiifolia]